MTPRAHLSTPLALLAAALALAGAPSPASAGGKTYCVGGFNMDSGGYRSRDVCGSLAEKHKDWHFHTYVRGTDGRCYACWDEKDDTCASLMPKEQPFTLIGEDDCRNPAPPETPAVYVPDVAQQPPPAPVQTPPPTPDGGPPPPPVQAPQPQPEPVRQPVKLAPPPVPKPVDFRGVVTVSPGPYAVGDPVTLTGAAEDDKGKRRRCQGGEFVVLAPDGTEKARLKAKATRGGPVTAELKLPISGAMKITFVPRGIVTRMTEEVRNVTPGEATLDASQCRLRGVVRSPAAGEVLVAGAGIALTGEVLDVAGRPVDASALGGARPVFDVVVAGESQRVAATIAGTQLRGTVALAAPAGGSEPVTIRLLGEGGEGGFCPEAPAEARVTSLGVALAVTPGATCYVDRPCPVKVELKLPSDPAARAAGEAFARAPDLKVTLTAQRLPVATLAPERPGAFDSPHVGTFVPTTDGTVELGAVAAAGGKEASETVTLRVRQPLELRLPAELDLGTVRAGSGWMETCRTLDFGASRGVLDQPLSLRATRPGGCDSFAVARAGADALGYPLHGGLELELGPDRKVPVCLAEIPWCAGESPAPAVLTVQALSPDFPDQKAEVRIRWRVAGRSFLACHWWWLAIVGGVAFVVFVGAGWVRPHRFGPDDAVKLASKKEQLGRAVARRLRELPGGRGGWYRSAATGLREDGSAVARLRLAAVELHARRGEVVLRSRGGLQRVSPQTKKLEPVTEAATAAGHIASKNVVYSVGSLYFQIT